MFTVIQIIMAAVAAGVLLAFVSEGFAGGLSRAFEAAADAIEYRLALRARVLRLRRSSGIAAWKTARY